jgi:hypothetical protein
MSKAMKVNEADQAILDRLGVSLSDAKTIVIESRDDLVNLMKEIRHSHSDLKVTDAEFNKAWEALQKDGGAYVLVAVNEKDEDEATASGTYTSFKYPPEEPDVSAELERLKEENRNLRIANDIMQLRLRAISLALRMGGDSDE